MNFPLLFDLIYSIKTQISKRFYTLITIIKYCLYPNVSFGKKISFFGIPKFKNEPGGKIIIGDHCVFRSKPTSNLIGINRPCIISTLTLNAEIIIENNCGFSGTVIGAFKSIHIGSNVNCGANTLITDSDWHTKDNRSGPIIPVVINNNVWLGEGVKVLKGVSIGENSVIGAGSVVTKSIPANVVAAGNPCKVIKDLIL
jgi:acetyltransferase-like isoleucine patch superfamily enzyme